MVGRRWSLAWNSALYGTEGFYRRQTPGAHFATSVSGVPGTTQVMADALCEFMDRQRLQRFLDLGAGSTGLAVCMASRRPGMPVVAVDIRPSSGPGDADSRGSSASRVKWIDVCPGTPGRPVLRRLLSSLSETLVFAHEWLDVLPCDIAEVGLDGSLRYVLFDCADGREVLGPPLTGRDSRWCRRYWPWSHLTVGDRLDIGRSRDEWWAFVVRSLRSGVAIAVDYGHTIAARPHGSTVAGYRGGRSVPPIPDGSCDITAQVSMDSLPARCVIEQRAVLACLGVRSDPPNPSTAAADPTGYLLALSRRAAGAALLGPGYGDALWAISTAGSDRPATAQEVLV